MARTLGGETIGTALAAAWTKEGWTGYAPHLEAFLSTARDNRGTKHFEQACDLLRRGLVQGRRVIGAPVASCGSLAPSFWR
jgi:hypothetical protein